MRLERRREVQEEIQASCTQCSVLAVCCRRRKESSRKSGFIETTVFFLVLLALRCLAVNQRARVVSPVCDL